MIAEICQRIMQTHDQAFQELSERLQSYIKKSERRLLLSEFFICPGFADLRRVRRWQLLRQLA